MPASVNSTLASFIHDLPWEMVQAAEMPHFWYAFHFNGRLHDWGPFYYFLPCTFIHHKPHLLSLHWDGSHQPARVRFLPCRSLPLFGMGRKRLVLKEGKDSDGSWSTVGLRVESSQALGSRPGISPLNPRSASHSPFPTHSSDGCWGAATLFSLERLHTPK